MRGIVFKTVAELVISLFAVGIFLLILNGIAPEFTKASFCTIGNAVSSMPVPSFLKPDMDSCGLTKDVSRQALGSPLTAETLTEFIIECWEDNGRGTGGVNYLCYELFAAEVSGSIDEEAIAAVLLAKGTCKILPDNFFEHTGEIFGCGDKNSLFWNVKGGAIEGRDATVYVKYNSFDHRVEVT
ncbi:MAG: hypothetical protein ACP5E4_01800 [Candidatus Aenigmatarchaeota archaeon]